MKFKEILEAKIQETKNEIKKNVENVKILQAERNILLATKEKLEELLDYYENQEIQEPVEKDTEKE